MVPARSASVTIPSNPSRLLVRGPSTTPPGGWMQGPAIPRWGGGTQWRRLRSTMSPRNTVT
jgi:hypothetical protein